MIGKELIDYIKSVRAQGYSDEQIKKFLKQYGYKDEFIKESLKIENNPAVPGLIKEAPDNHIAEDMGRSDSFNIPLGIRISSILNYILGFIAIITPFLFLNFFIKNPSLIIKIIIWTSGSILGILIIFSGYKLSKPSYSAKKFSSTINIVLITIIVILFFKETYTLNLLGMSIYFIILLLNLYIIYILFEKKYSKYFV